MWISLFLCVILIFDDHCVKSARIQSYSDPYFPTFGLNLERYGVSVLIQSKRGKIRTRITTNTDTFHVVVTLLLKTLCLEQLLISPWVKSSFAAEAVENVVKALPLVQHNNICFHLYSSMTKAVICASNCKIHCCKLAWLSPLNFVTARILDIFHLILL